MLLNKKQAQIIAERLMKRHSDAKIALNYGNAFELLVATILSAQCTDIRVNQVTQSLFVRYPHPQSFVDAPQEEIEEAIRPTGFFRNKAKSLKGLGKSLIERFGGRVPDRMEDLTTLPGIGRKTANVILGEIFKVPGIVVDTHVKRLAQRMGLTRQAQPEKIEQDLMTIFPKEIWTQLSHVLIFHGRRICVARKPKCIECPVNDICPSSTASKGVK